MTDVRTRAQQILDEHPEWYHSIELAPGLVTPGRTSLAEWQAQLDRLRLPDLAGKSVLDIGAYDGFFSFAAERRGAARGSSRSTTTSGRATWPPTCATGESRSGPARSYPRRTSPVTGSRRRSRAGGRSKRCARCWAAASIRSSATS